MDVAWIAYHEPTGRTVHLSLQEGWKVDAVMFIEDDLFGFLGADKLEPIEDEL